MIRPKQTVALLILSFMAISAEAQTGSIRGTVTDTGGAVVQGVKIQVHNTATGAERTATSTASGDYSLNSLPVGTYNLTAERDGFRKARFMGLELTVSQILGVDIRMEVGAVEQVVEVRGDSVAPIETETAQLSNIVDERRIKDLPLLTRNPYELVLLSPGTLQSNTRLGGFSVNGSRERNNNFQLDGTDNNDTSVPGGGSGLSGINPDSTQEFRVITNNYAPEHGRNTGAIIDIVTKSGTNEFHGTAYWFGRYHALGARDFFNHNPDPLIPGAVERQNPYVRNQFGFSFGGPIVKERTFFFVNSEFNRFRTTLTNQATVPTEAFKSGLFTFNGFAVDILNPASPNNVLGLTPSPTIQALFALFPAPNGAADDDARASLFYPSSDSSNSVGVTTRLDHRFNDKHSAFLRYVYNKGDFINPFHLDFPQGVAAVDSRVRSHSISANFTSLLSSTLINEARFGVNRVDAPFECVGTGTVDQFSTPDVFGRGSDFNFAGITSFGCTALVSNGQTRRTGTWQAGDNLTWVKGSHTIKLGGEYRFVFEDGFNSFFSRPSLSFNIFTGFGVSVVDIDPLTACNPFDPDPSTNGCEGGEELQNLVGAYYGLVDSLFQSQYFDAGGTRTADDNRRFRQREFGLYIQDSWKIRSNLTLNFGLRYERKGVPYERDGNFSNLFADASGAPPFTFDLVGSGARDLYQPDNANFEPRIGFSWDPFKNGKTVIRGAYGIFHDRIFGNLFGNARGNPPFQRDFQSFPGDFIENVIPPATQTPSPVVDDCSFSFVTFTCTNQALIFPILFDPNLKNPYSQNWNFGVQRELPGNVLLEVNYVGSKGTRLLRTVDGNPPQPNLVANLQGLGVPDAALEGALLYFFDPNVFGVYPAPAVNNTAFFQAALTRSVAFSTYNALQVNFTKRFSHGFQAQLAYTWSHGIDNASDPLDPAAGNRSFPRNSFNLGAERGQSDFDLRHRAVINYIWEVPLGKGRRYLNQGWAARILEGFQLSGIVAFQSGHPYEIFGNRDSEHTGVSNRADLSGQPAIPPSSPHNQTGPGLGSSGCSIDPLGAPPLCTFLLAPYGRGGNIGRNSFTGPTLYNWDFTLSKDTTITERVKLNLRAEVFNLFNRPQFGQPGNLIQSPGTFGLSETTLGRPDGTTASRQIQIAAKIIF